MAREVRGRQLSARWALMLVLMVYLGLGVAYALRTPPWQAPDEPAHFNYIRHLAEGRGLPVLAVGDYDQDYLETIKTARFPPQLSIDSIRYESHQPPLYYVLASPIAWATQSLPPRSQVQALRFFSLFWGGALLLLIYGLVKEVFPRNEGLALATVAFVALLPQHNAVAASVSNDILAEVLITAVPLFLVREFRRWRLPSPLLLGLLIGAALLTKTTAYPALILPPLAYALHRAPARAYRGLILAYGLALVMAGWWFCRNILVYGDLDILGLARHDLVVAGQPRTEVFDISAASHFAIVSFKSFWAQLGWMAVPADERVYIVLGVLSGVSALGLLLLAFRLAKEPFHFSPRQWAALGLLATITMAALAGMLFYNLRYIQPQGRYLFPAIAPLALGFVLGLRELVAPQYRTLVLVLVFAGMLLFNLYGLFHLLSFLYA